MSKFLFVLNLTLILLVGCSLVVAAPKPESEISLAEDLEVGAAGTAVEKDSDLEGSSSYGHGYYSSPYYGGHYGGYGGYSPYYGGYGGLSGLGGLGYYGVGYPYYGGYYGYQGLHGHFL